MLQQSSGRCVASARRDTTMLLELVAIPAPGGRCASSVAKTSRLTDGTSTTASIAHAEPEAAAARSLVAVTLREAAKLSPGGRVFERASHVDGDVVDGERATDLLGRDPLVEHRKTEGTRRRDLRRLCVHRLVDPAVVDARLTLFHPHPAAAGTAAHSLALAARHLHHLQARDALEDFPRWREDVVPAPQVTGVVIGDRLVLCLGGIEDDPAFLEQTVDQLGVMDDLVLAPEIAVFVGERVEAVRARRDDLANVVPLENFDVLPGALGKEIFVADPSCWIAGALLLGAEDGEIHTGSLEDLGERGRDRPGTLVEGRGATDPVQVFRIGLVGNERYVEILGPVRSGLM